MRWTNCLRLSLLLVLWAVSLPCTGAKRQGLRPQCPSPHCHCRWIGKGRRGRELSVWCPNISHPIPVFEQTNTIYSALSLRNKNISRVPDGAFTGIRMRILDLSNNSLNTEGCILPGSFTGLEQTLETLVLSDNGLPSVPVKSTSTLVQLRKLYLDHNNISQIGAEAFINNTLLQELYLYNNKIQQLSPDCFAGLSKLQYLKLKDNRIDQLPSNIFHSQKRLISLDLSNNNLKRLPKNTFRSLVRAKWLELQNNKLAKLDRRTFRGLKRLGQLRLHGNPLKRVGDRTFNAIRKLRYLSLDIIHIEDLDPKIFKGLHKLKMLIFGEVNSGSLPASIFAPLRTLRYITVFNHTGQFQSLSEHVFPKDMNISRLNFSIEPMDLYPCTCNATWIDSLTSRGTSLRATCGREGTSRVRYLSCPGMKQTRDPSQGRKVNGN